MLLRQDFQAISGECPNCLHGGFVFACTSVDDLQCVEDNLYACFVSHFHGLLVGVLNGTVSSGVSSCPGNHCTRSFTAES